ncbi:MAG: hypothetical protein Q9220_002247 [cf. Caloplaca sp. 1 TL-2023]
MDRQYPTPAPSSSPASTTALKGYDPNAPPFDFFTRSGLGPLDEHPDISWTFEGGVWRAYRLSTLQHDPTATPHLISPVNGECPVNAEMIVNRAKQWLTKLKEQAASMPPPPKPARVASKKRKVVNENSSKKVSPPKRTRKTPDPTGKSPSDRFQHPKVQAAGSRELLSQTRGNKRKFAETSEGPEKHKRRGIIVENQPLRQDTKDRTTTAHKASDQVPPGLPVSPVVGLYGSAAQNLAQGPERPKAERAEWKNREPNSHDETKLHRLECGLQASTYSMGNPRSKWFPKVSIGDDMIHAHFKDESVRRSSHSSTQTPQQGSGKHTSSPASAVFESQHKALGGHPYYASRDYLNVQSNLVAQSFAPVQLNNHFGYDYIRPRQLQGTSGRSGKGPGHTNGISDANKPERNLGSQSCQSLTYATTNEPYDGLRYDDLRKCPVPQYDGYQRMMVNVRPHSCLSGPLPSVRWPILGTSTESHAVSGQLLDGDPQTLYFNQLADVIAADKPPTMIHEETAPRYDLHYPVF